MRQDEKGPDRQREKPLWRDILCATAITHLKRKGEKKVQSHDPPRITISKVQLKLLELI